ncbi:unnamed protein product [Caenorhabditis sp. 36 PRJEB53466]|nr:unnamed protein product [Caenorhabditis sp. 36 PRJEB53466]
MTIKITTNTDDSQIPNKTEMISPTPISPEVMQHADVKIAKVMFTKGDASQILLLGKGRERCIALWERDNGIDPFKILATKNTDVDPNDAVLMTDDRVCIGYADGSLAIFNTDKDDLALMIRIPSVHSGCASRSVCRNGSGILSASTNGSLEAIDVETGMSRTVFSGLPGIRSICTTFGGNVVMAGDSNGQVTAWDLREDNERTTIIEPIKTLVPSKKALDSVSSLCTHPAQPNLVCCGTDEGIVGLIDARNIRTANITSTYLVAKRGISQVMFHPTCVDSLIVSSNDGCIVRIDSSSAPIAVGTRATKDTIWLEGDIASSLRLESIRNESVHNHTNQLSSRVSRATASIVSLSALLPKDFEREHLPAESTSDTITQFAGLIDSISRLLPSRSLH